MLDSGFRTPIINQLVKQDSYSKLAIDYLRKVNPGLTNFSEQQVQRVVYASSFVAEEVEDEEPSLLLLDTERRCRRLFEPELLQDKRLLFLLTLFKHYNCTEVNLWFTRQDLFKLIFGSFPFTISSFAG